jgi:radical SAM protein with 4Fe4S-binding SPASM domain
MAALFVKAVNLLLSGSSYLHSTFTGKPVVWGMPAAISTELTNHCNLDCPECFSGSGKMTRERGYMDITLFRNILEELRPYLYNVSLYFQGEPMLHPQFFDFLKHSGDLTTTVSTNGHFLTVGNSEKIVTSGLDRLIVSLDGMDQTVYSRYRKNGDLSRVITGIDNLLAARKKVHSSLEVEVQFLVNRFNEHQIVQAERFANEREIRLRFKSMQVINEGSIEEWMPEMKKFRRYKMKGSRYVIKSSLPDRCRRLWFNPVVTWDGKVIPCCFDKNADHVMGDLNKNSFREIWNGSEYQKFRSLILTGRSHMDICRNCTEGLKGVKT